MVDRVDRPDAPSAYRIKEASSTADDRGGKRDQQENEWDEYSGSHATSDWHKIYAAKTYRRYIKLKTALIERCWYKHATMQRGIALLEADISLKNGQVVRNAHMILPNHEDYWKIKIQKPGEEIPLVMIAREPIIEISIPVAPPKQERRVEEKKGMGINKTINLPPAVIAVLAGILVIIFGMILYIIGA
jgi:hypothetical protein